MIVKEVKKCPGVGTSIPLLGRTVHTLFQIKNDTAQAPWSSLAVQVVCARTQGTFEQDSGSMDP
jgi:hypothetical protein